ncbi:MAG TPA: DUF433 domain-containing protein [Micromonosporaceae bacterium]|nr:DUF433 domain-containing protein [Micromonosporaceae bacterium]
MTYDLSMGQQPAGSGVVFLERALYGFGDVDRLLSLSHGTARRWVDGYNRRGKSYEPIVRATHTGNDIVTWGEFVEASLLAGYREAGVRIVRLRPIVQGLRQRLGIPYPLAHLRPLVDPATLALVNELEDAANLDPDLRLVVRVADGQVTLAAPVRQFKMIAGYGDRHRDDPDSEIVVRLHPLGHRRSVTIDPLQKFGQPVVRAVPTAVLFEQYSAGDPIELIADSYELTRNQVLDAIEFERQRDTGTAA